MTNKTFVLMAMMALTMYIGTVQSQTDLEYCDEVLPDDVLPEVPEEPVEEEEEDTDEPVEEPVDEPVEEEVDEPIEEPVDPVEEDTEEPVEEDNETQVEEDTEEPVEDPIEEDSETPVEEPTLEDGEVVVVEVNENETRDVEVDCGYCEPEPDTRFILPEITCRNVTTSSLVESTSMTTFTSYSTIIQTFTSESPVVYSVPTMFCEQVCETSTPESTETTETTATETEEVLPTNEDIVIDDSDRSLQGASGAGASTQSVLTLLLCGLFVFVV